MKKALINVHPFQTSTFPLQQAAAYQWQSESVPALLNHIATDKASCSNFQGLFYKNLASDNKERKARVLDPSPVLESLWFSGGFAHEMLQNISKNNISSGIPHWSSNNVHSTSSKPKEKLMKVKKLLCPQQFSETGCSSTELQILMQHIFWVFLPPVLWESLYRKAVKTWKYP